MYALVAAHLAQLILNWHNDSFVLRQRVNFIRGGKSSKKERNHKPPEALPMPGLLRMLRLVIATIILIATMPKKGCENVELCDHDVSQTTHVFGGLAGLLTGCIFLKVRSFKRPFNIFRNVLFILLYGFAFLWIFGNFYHALQNDSCPWIEYETVCQLQCYRPDENHKFNNSITTSNCTVNICL